MTTTKHTTEQTTGHTTEHDVHTNLGLDVTAIERAPTAHHVVPPHVDPFAREEMREGWLPDHGTNFGLVLPLQEDDGQDDFDVDDDDDLDVDDVGGEHPR